MRAVRIAFSPARPSRLKNPPGILPAAYIFSSTSTVSGKKSAPSRPSVRPTAVASTTVLSLLHQHRAVRLLGDGAGLEADLLVADRAARRVAPGSTAMLMFSLFSPRARANRGPSSGLVGAP